MALRRATRSQDLNNRHGILAGMLFCSRHDPSVHRFPITAAMVVQRA